MLLRLLRGVARSGITAVGVLLISAVVLGLSLVLRLLIAVALMRAVGVLVIVGIVRSRAIVAVYI